MRGFNFQVALTVFIVVGLMATTSHATDCEDVSDDSVANCCVAYNGSCEGCLPGYGLSKDTTQCNKCLTPNCAICDGDVSVCTQQNLVEDPHCSYWQDSVSGCIECEEGYTLLGQTCLKCLVPNCGLCDPSRLKTCRDCAPGYAPIKNGKACSRCKVPNCELCRKGVNSCDYCKPGFWAVKNKCVRDPKKSKYDA